jgi:hypothetical protein
LNDAARDVLVAAALRGHKQVTKMYHGNDGGDCALGVLHATLHGTRQEAMDCASQFSTCLATDSDGTLYTLKAPINVELQAHFDISPHEARTIIAKNDAGWDFLDVAYKIGVKQEAP